MVLTVLGCIGIIDGTLVKICRPWKNLEHGKWFNGRKKMYYMNNVVIIDHHGLFIYVDLGYPGLFHDVVAYRHQTCMGRGMSTSHMMMPITTLNICWIYWH